MSLGGCGGPQQPSGNLPFGAEGCWHQPGSFSQALAGLDHHSGSVGGVQVVPLGQRELGLPFTNVTVDAFFNGRYWLMAVAYEYSDVEFRLTPANGTLVGLWVTISSPAEQTARVTVTPALRNGARDFLHAVADLDERQAAAVVDQWMNQTEPRDYLYWEGSLDLRLPQLFGSLNVDMTGNNPPQVESPWDFRFRAGYVAGIARVGPDFTPVGFAVLSTDRVYLHFEESPGSMNEADFRLAARELLSAMKMSEPTFDGLKYSSATGSETPCRGETMPQYNPALPKNRP